MLVDSHCHLDLLTLSPNENLEDVIARAQAHDVGYILNVCVSMTEFPKILATAKRYAFVGASVGLHPNEQEEEVDFDTLVALGADKKIVAIGETGLDYYRTTGDTEWQRARFRTHIAAAKTLGKALIVHTRNAKADTMEILRAEKASEVGGVMHCFTEDWETARAALDLGFYISFSGIVSFKSATELQAVAKKVPLDRMLVETDSPYLAPNPYRGKQNEPAYVKYTAEYLAELRGESLATIADATTENFFNLFVGANRTNV